MKKIILACGLLVLGALAAGCGGKNKCEASADTIALRLDECEVNSTEGSEAVDPPECTEELGAEQECKAGCYSAASCETHRGQDPAGSVTFSGCLADCTAPAM
jgi:hypothetical protein